MNFKFVDLIRFFSMGSIVFGHSLATFTPLNNPFYETSFYWALGPMKFGTICFYIISGFLLGEKVTQTSSLTYLKRRYDNTFQPYLRTVVAFVLFCSIGYFIGHDKVQSFEEYGLRVVQNFFITILYTNYWFIINFFISLIFILLFKRFLFSYAFPIAAFLTTSVYTVNIYLEYFPAGHTTAFFGFIFYLWLGIFINKHKVRIINYLDNTSLWVFLIAGVCLIGLNIGESYFLKALHSDDPFNTLKVANQLYSLLIFSLLVKIRELKLPALFNSKKDTYGIYLYHPFLILILSKAISFFGHAPILHSPYLLLVAFIAFLSVYFITLLVVKCLNNPPTEWPKEFKTFIKFQGA